MCCVLESFDVVSGDADGDDAAAVDDGDDDDDAVDTGDGGLI